jgi:hypothetical protein
MLYGFSHVCLKFGHDSFILVRLQSATQFNVSGIQLGQSMFSTAGAKRHFHAVLCQVSGQCSPVGVRCNFLLIGAKNVC